jgi:hypothetical protein
MPPINVTARSVSESCVWNDWAVGWPTCAARRQPATPAMNAASANAQSL